VQEEVGRLPERLRAAVLLCEFEGLTGEQAAKQLNCAVGTVKSRLSRARERLRRRLSGQDLDAGLVISSVVPPRLIESTVAMVRRSLNGGTKVWVTAAMAAWEAGVLRSLLMVKLKTVFAVVGALGLTASGAILVAQTASTPQKNDASAKPKRAASLPNGQDLVSLLAKTRVEVAEQLVEQEQQLYQNGRTSFTEVLKAHSLVNEARLDASDDPDDRIAVLRKSLSDATQLELATKNLVEQGRVSSSDLLLSRYARLEAALRLAEATTGSRPSRKRVASEKPLDATAIQTLLGDFQTEQGNAALKVMLQRPMTLDLPEGATLSDALKAIKAASVGWASSGLPIYVDPEGLTKANTTSATPIALTFVRGTVGEVLDKVVSPLGLMYAIKDGLILIAAQ
jgi:hypothetical protein